MSRRPFRTVIVGSCTLFREGLTQILDQAGFRIVASRPGVADLPHDLRSPPRPILLIIDAGNDLDHAIKEIALFKGYQPAARIAVIADSIKLDVAISAFRAGAHAYFLKDSTVDSLVKFLDLVMRGETILLAGVIPPTVDFEGEQQDVPPVITEKKNSENAASLLNSDNTWTPDLSTREKCILRCLIQGDSNKAIARKINIAEATVKVHIKAILRKIRAQNRTQAAIWAVNNASRVWTGENAGFFIAGEPHRPSGARAGVPALLEGQTLGTEISTEDD